MRDTWYVYDYKTVVIYDFWNPSDKIMVSRQEFKRRMEEHLRLRICYTGGRNDNRRTKA